MDTVLTDGMTVEVAYALSSSSGASSTFEIVKWRRMD